MTFPTRRRLILFFALAFATLFFFSTWFIGQLLRDRNWLSGLCFFFPSPLAAALLVLTAATALVLRVWRMAAVAAFAAVWPLIFVAALENQWREPPAVPAAASPWRLVHWNVGYLHGGWEPVRDELLAHPADCWVLTELKNEARIKELAQVLGGPVAYVYLGEVSVLARGELAAGPHLTCGEGEAWFVTWRVDGQTLKLLAVDLPSSVWIERRPLLEWVGGLIRDEKPDLVVGDFNAPRRSWELERLPDGYRHAYDAVGTGWSYTWPEPCPLWAIDQCLLGPALQPESYRLVRSRASRHALQEVEFSRTP